MGERGGVTKKKSSKSMNQVEPSKNKSAKAWEQSKGDSGDLNHNYYRWLQSALNSAVGEHRWEDAFKLLPCLILHRCYNVSSDFLWRMMNIITKSAKEVPEGMRKSMSRDFLLLPTKTIVVVLDTLAEELETATDERIDEILQMLEDYKNDRRSEKWSVKNKDVRLTALIDAYRGLVLYSRWKNHTYSNQDSSAVQEKITGLLENMSDEENEDGGKDSNRGLVNKAHSALRRALCNLAEPVEWIIVPYLDLENELRGPESALAVLQDYVSKNLQHLPAQHLVYNFLRTFVPNSDETQMSALKEITRVCPEHPLTLEYVDRLMAEACDEEVWKRTETAVDSDETESKVSMNQSNDSETETQSCGLKSDIQVESLVRALNLLTNLLEYKEWQWKLQPWQTLTHILRKFYSCWLRCWKCPYCRKSRKSVRQVSKSITPLWKYYVWVAVPVSLTPEKAQVIFHHIYSAHVFCYNQTYVRNAISTLQKANYKVLCNELKESLYPEKTYIDKFLAYSLKKSDFQTVVDSVEVSSSTKTGEKEASTKKRKTKKNAVSDIQLSEDELPPVVTRKKSVLKTLDDLPFPGEDSKKSQRKGHTPPAEPKRVKEVKSTVASKLTSLSTPPTRNIKSVRNLRTSPDEGKREASFLSSDISFHEDFFLTSTQVRPGNKQILDTSLGESPALLPALKERDTLREKEKSKLKLSKAKEKHRNVEEEQKDYEISSEDPDDCSNDERSDFNNHTEVSKLNSSSAEEYVTVNETTEEATNITSNSNVKNSTVLNRKSITSSLNTTYTLDSPMTSMTSKSEGSVQVNHSYRNKKRSSTDVCSSNIVDKTHDKTAECSSPEPEDYLPCGQRPREDRSSGYKGGSSEGQNESSLANTGNDSVYFCYTALPTHINPAVLVLDSQAASEQNNCLVDETLTETNSNPLDGYEGKCIIQETQSQEILSQSVVDSTSQVTDFPNPNGCGLGAGKNYVKVECEDTGTQYSENSEPFSLTQGQQEPMPFSQNAQELVYSADVTDTTDFTTFCKTELTSPLSEKEYKIFEVQYEDIEQEATSPSTLEVFDSVKQESVTVGNPTSVVHGTTVEFSDIDNDKFASPKCAVEEIIHSNCLDTPTAEDYLPCGQRPREDRSSGYKGGSSEGQNESSLANTGNDSVYFCYTALPTHINPAVLVLDSQAASEQNNCLVDETLTETNSNPLDGYEGKCIIQETQSQEILSQSVVDSTSQVTDFPNPNGCGLGAGKNYVKVECEDTGTQYSENSEPFSLTQGQQEPMPFSQNAQELVYSADVTDTTDFTTFCKTELTSPLSEKEYKIFEVQYEDIEQEATSPSTLEVFDSVKQESVTVGNPTSVVHGTTVEFSDIDNDKFASPKCAVEEIIHSNCLDTPTAAASNEETSDSEEVIGPSQELVVTSPPNFKSFNRSSRSCGSASGGSFVSNTSGESEQDQASLSIYSSLTALQDFSPTVAESEKIGRKDREKDILEVLPLNSSKGSVQEEMEYASLTCKEKQRSSHGKELNDLHPSLTQNQRGDVTVRNTSTISNITLVDNKEQEILDVLCERPVKSDHHSDESFVTADSVADRLSRESLQSVDTNDDSESQSSSTSKLRIDISNSNLLPGNSSAAETTDVRDRCDQNAKKNQKKGKTTANSDVSATVDAHKNQGMDSVTNEVGNTDVDSFVTALDESQRGKQKKKYCALEATEDVVSELFTNDVETFKSKKKKKEKKPEITILPTMQVNGIQNSDEVDGSIYETSKKSKKGKEKKRKEKTSDKVSEKTEQANLVSHSSKSKKKHKSDETETEEDCDKYWLDLCIDLPFPDLDKENEVLVSENSSSKSKSHKTKTKNDTSKASILKCSIIDSDELEIPDFDNLEPEDSIREKINTRKSSRNKNKKEEKESNKSEDHVNKKKCLESKEETKEVVHLDVSENQEKKKSKKKKLQEKLQVDVFDIEVDKKHKSTNNIGQKVDDGLSLPTKREKKKHKKEKDDFITCDLLPFPDIEIEGCSISKAENESVDGITSQKKKRKNEDIDIRSLNTKRKKKEYLETSTSKDIDEKCNGNTSIKATPEVSQVNGHYDCSDLDKRKKHKKNKSKATENESLPGLDVESMT
ncbi:uncharacterized protein LOC134783910 [Penaeus indicus]|uniref:uncharacterized protein LOC134783910 n=1 Tax=Penaeus indicus TaxID=29960 RepID=UPI00300C9B9F